MNNSNVKNIYNRILKLLQTNKLGPNMKTKALFITVSLVVSQTLFNIDPLFAADRIDELEKTVKNLSARVEQLEKILNQKFFYRSNRTFS